MNAQLVNSIIQVVRALPQAEQKVLIDSLNRLSTPTPIAEKQPEDSAKKDLAIAASSAVGEAPMDEDAWELWRSLGDDAVSGRLKNPSINHDQYLYPKS